MDSVNLADFTSSRILQVEPLVCFSSWKILCHSCFRCCEEEVGLLSSLLVALISILNTVSV